MARHEEFRKRAIRPLPVNADTIPMVWFGFTGRKGTQDAVPAGGAPATPVTERSRSRRGVALLMVVFVIALLTTAVSGIIQLNSEELQVMTNHVGMVQAHAIAEAGIANAIARKRMDPAWDQGFQRHRFAEGTYSVAVDGTTLTSTGCSSQGYQARMTVDISILGSIPPYDIRVNAVRLNQ